MALERPFESTDSIYNQWLDMTQRSRSESVMKRLLLTGYLILFFGSVVASFEYRDLTDVEESAVRAAASNASGLGVWLIQGRVIRVEAGDNSLVNVLFDPADVSGYCLAPSAFFTAESPDRELLDWSLIEGGAIQYRFWYEACDEVDPLSPVVLEQYVDTSILERLRTQKSLIVSAAVQDMFPELEYNVPASEHELRGISIHFDADHGAVYKLNYWGTNCRGLSIDVVLRRDEISVLRSAQWVC